MSELTFQVATSTRPTLVAGGTGTTGHSLVERLRTGGLDEVAEGAVHPALARPERSGLVTSHLVPSDRGRPAGATGSARRAGPTWPPGTTPGDASPESSTWSGLGVVIFATIGTDGEPTSFGLGAVAPVLIPVLAFLVRARPWRVNGRRRGPAVTPAG